MVKFRIGKDFSRTCPACPRTENIGCLNPLTETNHFETNDTVYAIYETQCEGNTLGTQSQPYGFAWYQWLQDTWSQVFAWTPDGLAPTAVYSYYNITIAGCYKVEYRDMVANGTIAYSKQFDVGTHTDITCPDGENAGSSTVMWVIIGIIVIAILAYLIMKK